MTVRGSCHCGHMTYELEREPSEAMECNCSICSRRGYLLHFPPLDQVRVNADPDKVGVYRFGAGNVSHQFCKVCGCSPFGTGKDPRGNDMIAINLRCSDMDLRKLKIRAFDGASL